MKFNKLAVAVTSAVLLMAGNVALADSTSDIVNVLVDKGILTPEEGKLISKNSVEEKKKAQKESGKIKVGEFIDNAELYGNMRARYEYRSGTGPGADTVANNGVQKEERNRARGKFEFGVNTKAGDWYSDIAFATGTTGSNGYSSARSDNFTFGGANTNYNQKETIFLKRAMLGWNATSWLTVEAGRMNNPLYTTAMVWDADYQVSGFQEKVKFNVGSAEIFGVAGQWANGKWDSLSFDGANGGTNTAGSSSQSQLFAFQAGLKTPITQDSSAKIAVTQYKYGGQRGTTTGTAYVPGLSTAKPGAVTDSVYGLDITEIPAELNYMATSSIGLRLYGDYVYNHSAQDRADLAGATYSPFGGEDTSWLLGFKVASAKDLKSFEGNKAKAGDWSANIWYQELAAFAQDPNLNDSDFFDSRLNMKGGVFKAQYNLEDNVWFNLAYGHGTRLNKSLGTPYTAGQDLGLNIDKMDLLQLDVTYKF